MKYRRVYLSPKALIWKNASVCLILCTPMHSPDYNLVLRRQLAYKLAQKKTTMSRASELQQKCNSLRHHIEKWRDIQLMYMPGVTQARAMFKSGKLTPADLTQSKSSSTSTSNLSASTFSVLAEHPERMPLFLPSQMPTSLWQTGCAPGLVEKEKRLRVAQVDDALLELRRLL